METSNDFSIKNQTVNTDQPCIELRFLIPSKVAGSIIGKSGENIRNLRRLFMARINVSDNSGPERILSLEADIDTILDILRQSVDKLEDNGQLPRSGSGDITDLISNQIDIRMLVNQSLVGAMIGRGGGRINDLREKCDLRVLKVYQNVCPESTDRVVQMVGAITPITECIGKVVDICKETPVKEPKINYEAQNYDPTQAPHYGGWIQTLPRPDPNVNKGCTSLGFSRPTYLKGQGGQCYVYNYSNNLREPDLSFQHIPPLFEDHGSEANNDYKQTIRLPHRMVGAIIGPGGSRIQQIRLESEAQITISSPDRSPQERTVTISGSVASVKRAQYMINDCLDKYGK